MIERAKPAAQAALDQTMYDVRTQRAINTQRHFMRAMAELGTGPCRSGDIADTRDRSSRCESEPGVGAVAL